MKPDFPLLGLLARRPASGYDLGKWLQGDGRFLGRKSSMSPIYRALADFEARGWVTVSRIESDQGPAANVHRLTPEGREALVVWAKTPHTPTARPMDVDFMVKLNFAGQLGPEYALPIVQTELAFRRHQREQELSNPSPSHDIDPIPEIDAAWLEEIYHLTEDRGWQNTSLLISWLETTERYLKRLIQRQQATTA
ncbi:MULTISPECIES: PadR family transcriptional regulator [Actinomyces]|uniref:PadR family transcriptional regulator n=1 Tax=Actinomyces respiraculi TaxID=2744574 RepID=A0A7T0LKE2_9ACTO|nr:MULTISPECIES: PadR family transcriptional regulator [Actinomyces]QPL05386.1 PadR family transcriptional regulator [Actinomyces respiraculi]